MTTKRTRASAPRMSGTHSGHKKPRSAAQLKNDARLRAQHANKTPAERKAHMAKLRAKRAKGIGHKAGAAMHAARNMYGSGEQVGMSAESMNLGRHLAEGHKFQRRHAAMRGHAIGVSPSAMMRGRHEALGAKNLREHMAAERMFEHHVAARPKSTRRHAIGVSSHAMKKGRAVAAAAKAAKQAEAEAKRKLKAAKKAEAKAKKAETKVKTVKKAVKKATARKPKAAKKKAPKKSTKKRTAAQKAATAKLVRANKAKAKPKAAKKGRKPKKATAKRSTTKRSTAKRSTKRAPEKKGARRRMYAGLPKDLQAALKSSKHASRRYMHTPVAPHKSKRKCPVCARPHTLAQHWSHEEGKLFTDGTRIPSMHTFKTRKKAKKRVAKKQSGWSKLLGFAMGG